MGPMRIVAVGGRIKAAGVGLSHLYGVPDPAQLDESLKKMRLHPNEEFIRAFFPADYAKVRQMVKGVGFYRPVLKTDQGMAGNFLPFSIDYTADKTNLSVKKIVKTDVAVISEPYFSIDRHIVRTIEDLLNKEDFQSAREMIANLNTQRRAEKGRNPFFFIQPAGTDEIIVICRDLVEKVVVECAKIIEKIEYMASEEEKRVTGRVSPNRLLYCQPDVFILQDGTVAIERINCPDVGMFLLKVTNPYSPILPQIHFIVERLLQGVYETIARSVVSRKVFMVTRDEVVFHKEDVLEIEELNVIRNALQGYGIESCIIPVSNLESIPDGSHVLLFNVNYEDSTTNKIFERHKKEELIFYPNPFFQKASQRVSGLPETVIPSRYKESFLKLIGGIPSDREGYMNIWGLVKKLLEKYNITSDIVYADIGSEVVPVFCDSLHSWRQLERRIKRQAKDVSIILRQLPLNYYNSLLTSGTGPRVCTFRFMIVQS